MRRLIIGGALAASTLLGSLLPATAATTVKVTVGDIGNHWFAADTRAPGTGTFESGPATPPYGNGSFELNTMGGNAAKVQLFTDLYDGVKLATIDGIGYSTYRDPASTGFIAGLAALNIRADLDGGGTADAYMVYEPYQDQGNAAVQTGAWQTWDAYNGGAAKWWINSGAGGCGQNTPCSWSAILAAFPNATVREAPNCGPGGVTAPCRGSLGVNQGSFNSGIISNADGLWVSVGGQQTVYNFDLPVGPPTAKDQCKNGGWQTFDAPRVFKNQGDCVSFVNTGK